MKLPDNWIIRCEGRIFLAKDGALELLDGKSLTVIVDGVEVLTVRVRSCKPSLFEQLWRCG